MTTVGEESMSLVMDSTIEPSTQLSALRERLTATLHHLGEDHLYDVLLVVTELVSNVLDHASGLGRLRVLHCRKRCEVTVEADDDSPLRPVYGRSRVNDTRGRGIVVIAALAQEWGTRPLAGGGKTVFATLCCPGGSG